MFSSILLSLFLILFIFLIKKIWTNSKLKKESAKLYERLAKYHKNRKERLATFEDPKYNFTQEFINSILNADATELIQKLNLYELTSEQLLNIFYKRAITIGTSLQALAETNYPAALQQARICDTYRESFRTTPSNLANLPPLYGLPISVKSNLILAPLPPTLGCLKFVPPTSLLPKSCAELPNIQGKSDFDVSIYYESLMVGCLIEAGAIPFITSNIPQCLMLPESVNRIWGRCENPYDSGRTPGGSSGGEAALIAACCSPLGIGSDIGGSIRIPCLWCGLVGIKFTSTRITFQGGFGGNKSGKRGNNRIRSCWGPMGKSVRDIALTLDSLLTQKMFQSDPDVPPIPFDTSIYLSKSIIKIGVVLTDDYFPTSSANLRAVKEAAAALEQQGVEIKFLTLPNLERGVLNYYSIMSAAGKFRPFSDMMGAEGPIEEYALLEKMAKLPNWSRKIIAKLLRIKGEKRKADLVIAGSSKTAYEFFQVCKEQDEIKEEFFKWWRSNNIDGLITPGLGLPALKHGTSLNLSLACCYTFYFNLLDYPTGVVPITVVRENEQKYEDPFWNDSITDGAKKTMEGSKGLPVGIQVTTLPYKEELCLNIMRRLEEKIGWKGIERGQNK